MTTAAEAVEIAMRGVTFTTGEASRLHTLVDARTRRTAREHLDSYLGNATMPEAVRQNLPRLIREALAEQAQEAIHAADEARRGWGDGDAVYEAVRQALLSDRPGA